MGRVKKSGNKIEEDRGLRRGINYVEVQGEGAGGAKANRLEERYPRVMELPIWENAPELPRKTNA